MGGEGGPVSIRPVRVPLQFQSFRRTVVRRIVAGPFQPTRILSRTIARRCIATLCSHE